MIKTKIKEKHLLFEDEDYRTGLSNKKEKTNFQSSLNKFGLCDDSYDETK